MHNHTLRYHSPIVGTAALAILLLAPITFTSRASAQSCVMMDINFQLGMRGTQTPSKQVNDVEMNSNPDCYSGTAVTHSNQTAVSPGPITQIREAKSSINSKAPDGLAGTPGFEGSPAIKVPVNVQIDLYNPALDQTFIKPGS